MAKGLEKLDGKNEDPKKGANPPSVYPKAVRVVPPADTLDSDGGWGDRFRKGK